MAVKERRYVGIEKLIRPHLVEVQAYEPVDPPEVLAERARIPEDQVIKLNGNENPYGAAPRVAKAVAGARLHIYPDPLQRKMREALAGYTGLSTRNIVVGAGSDELIDLLFRLFISPGDKVVDCEPTFAMYAFCARVAGAQIKMVPRNDLFDIDVAAVKNALDGSVQMVFVTSPNNPTGNLAGESEIIQLLETGRMVVVDEAYFEFCNETVVGLVQQYDNLVVLRTMSKWAGLAGVRVGYGVMSTTVADHMFDIKPPYSVSVTAEAALLASLEDTQVLMGNVDKVVHERGRLTSLLKEIEGVTPWPSSGNFILCQFAPGRVQDIYEGLASRGIFVRNFRSPRLRDCFRVAVGTPAHGDAFIGALRELLATEYVSPSTY